MHTLRKLALLRQTVHLLEKLDPKIKEGSNKGLIESLNRFIKIVKEDSEKEKLAKEEVLIAIHSEEDESFVKMKIEDAVFCKELLLATQDGGEYPMEINPILDKYKEITPFVPWGTINTMGDGWGWYEKENPVS